MYLKSLWIKQLESTSLRNWGTFCRPGSLEDIWHWCIRRLRRFIWFLRIDFVAFTSFPLAVHILFHSTDFVIWCRILVSNAFDVRRWGYVWCQNAGSNWPVFQDGPYETCDSETTFAFELLPLSNAFRTKVRHGKTKSKIQNDPNKCVPPVQKLLLPKDHSGEISKGCVSNSSTSSRCLQGIQRNKIALQFLNDVDFICLIHNDFRHV